MAGVLEGTVALITGASSGIGEACALTLAEQGAALALAARRVERLEALADKVRDAGGTALVLEADISSEEQARAAVDRTVSELGRLDTLVNNAGLMLLGPVALAEPTEWRRMVDINLVGLFNTSHAALPHLVHAAEQQPRRVADLVNIGSLAGRFAFGASAVYCATKFGVGAYSEALRQEVATRHVRVSVVEPGSVDTELRTHNRPEVQEQLGARFSGIERLQGADVADAVSYIVTRPRHIAVSELLIRPTEQV
ncbi:SDR family NAD(P)-dependent oxidoreductase [Kitasatospora atroaurantiaca]|uniref:NADP-dependent 3-hydroxy acid dehydrogenase YdfG n=1 Tax=Kitasatospora atroaurantiaca TaxID=285545 RepID=A0A561EXU3_9ACTN|nr:SDR family NAD(P)-dependent oxidoreductase [Kitasatospora atroaurantiaca]TWE20432.1 NADP-dependent 3-hydroxy acid dehydrogenase YdfG [Kitasatospora atroaurantiaca]